MQDAVEYGKGFVERKHSCSVAGCTPQKPVPIGLGNSPGFMVGAIAALVASGHSVEVGRRGCGGYSRDPARGVCERRDDASVTWWDWS